MARAPFALRSALSLSAAGLALAPAVARADQTLVFDGTLTEEAPDHVFLDFEVPAGTAEIEVQHDDLSEPGDEDILDWGLYDPAGFRGWGGGNDEPAIVSELAASRSYLAGPIAPGTWRVVIGKAKLVGGSADYHVEVLLKDLATLAPQPEREPYEDPGVIVAEARWYAGDFHVHSRESGDARPPIDEVVEFAKSRGLDFVELSEHNTTSQLDFMNDAQRRAGDFLLLPGVEFTTYDGHANGLGATAFVDHKIGLPGVTIDAAADAFAAQGALLSINHPAFDLGDACIGCAWGHELEGSKIAAVEVATAATGGLFYDETVAFWEGLAEQGHRLAALGGSDDHRAGVDEGPFQSGIGSPTTLVYAEELSTAGILAGIAAGRTVVKLRGPDDPMVELAVVEGAGQVDAHVTGGAGLTLRAVVDGVPGDDVALASDDEQLSFTLTARADGAPRRCRLEVWEGTAPVTLTSHVWLDIEPEELPPPTGGGESVGGGGGCESGGPGAPAWAALAVLGALALARRNQLARLRAAQAGGST